MKLAAMVVFTTALAALLSCSAMLITTRNWVEPVDLGLATAAWGWLALFHLVVFMLPLTCKLEPNPFGMRWLYYALPIGVALVWTALLDGPVQIASYVFAILIGFTCGIFWIWLLKALDPWSVRHA